MSDHDQFAALAQAEHAPAIDPVKDEEDRLRPAFVERVLDAVADGDDEAAQEMVQALHPADVADLIELARADERDGLVAALADLVDADVLAELNEFVREDVLDEMSPEKVAEMVGALAPRHVLIVAPKEDSNFKADSVDRVAKAAKDVFKLYGKPDNLRVEHPDGGHDFPPAMRERAYKLFDAVLTQQQK